MSIQQAPPYVWQPTEFELVQAYADVLGELPSVFCEALFIHGAPIRSDDLDKNLLDTAYHQYDETGMVTKMVLNGLTVETCRANNLAYAGYEPWKAYLLELGMREEDIIILEPSAHTGTESRNLLQLAKAQGWQNIAIKSYGHHQLRCFLQIIALMDEVGYKPKVYNMPAVGVVPWDLNIKKPVMTGGTAASKDVDGKYDLHFGEEIGRIIQYAQPPFAKPDGRISHTRNATFEEMYEYLKYRDRN
jgi:hypothetical protein